ncbi:MAG: YjgP/YjgQ family permease [Lentisphaerae bacterium]|nr:YjgP/YjgQ family permease [Lentisphaerota bacterium]
MNLLQRYVGGSFLSAFILGMLVLTFVLSVGLLVKAMELVVRGLSPALVLRFLLVSLPQSFTFTVPLSALVSALLVFGRLSADGEINAMKACGVNIWQVMLPLAGMGVLMSILSVYINHQISPQSHFARRSLSALASSGAGLKLLQPGHFIQEFPGMTFWFARREGNELFNLLIFDKSKNNRNREIRAERARVEIRGDDVWLDMRQVRIEPFSDTHPGAVTAERLTHVIPDAMKPRQYKPTVSSLKYGDLKQDLLNLQRETEQARHSGELLPAERELILADLRKRISTARTEFHRRIALGLSPLVFILLGMPLGIRSHRRESNVGIAISMGVMVLYYSLLIVTKTLGKRPEFYPHALIWLPTLICGVLAWVLIRKNQ